MICLPLSSACDGISSHLLSHLSAAYCCLPCSTSSQDKWNKLVGQPIGWRWAHIGMDFSAKPEGDYGYPLELWSDSVPLFLVSVVSTCQRLASLTLPYFDAKYTWRVSFGGPEFIFRIALDSLPHLAVQSRTFIPLVTKHGRRPVHYMLIWVAIVRSPYKG